MIQDFAKIKPEPVMNTRPVETPPAWTLLFTGFITGTAIGVFACFLLYLSGNVPPLQSSPVALAPEVESTAVAAAAARVLEQEPPAAEPEELQLEFYQALQNYEVKVDEVPVEIVQSETLNLTNAAIPPSGGIMLQSGAFEQRASADTQRNRLQGLGLNTVVKEQALRGRTLFLVQSGPFAGNEQLRNAEALLGSNNISSIRISLQ